MSIILLVPSWGSVFNGILTINGAWDKVRTDPAVRFMMVAMLFYGLSTFEGSFLCHSPCQHPEPLHRLDCGPCACRCSWLGGVHQLWGDVQAGAVDLAARGNLFAETGGLAFLARAFGNADLCGGHVEFGHHPIPDVANL